MPVILSAGTMIPAEATGLPVAPVVPNIWMIPTKGLPVIGPGFMPATNVIARARNRAMFAVATRIFDGGLPAYNSVRADYGLRPLRSIWDQVRNADRLVVLSSATFDFAAAHLPDHVRYVGPVLDDPAWAEPWMPPTADDDRPLVMVALSSTFQDQAETLRRIVDALAELPVRAIVTLGQMLDETTLDPPA
jgi:UDP:flavonoid glycosyltransferase YjiC (YdhE family)